MGEIKLVGFNFVKCTSNSSSDLGESKNISGILYDSKEYTKRVDCRWNALDSNSNTLGVKSSKYNGYGIDLKGSEDEISLGCNGTK